MTDASDTRDSDSFPKKRLAIFPWLVLLTVAALLIGLNFFDDALADAFNLDPAIKHIASFLLPCVCMVSIGLWYLLRRARSLNLKTALAVLVILLPVCFFVLLEPVFGGNANLLGFKPRLWEGKVGIFGRKASSDTSRLTKTEFDFPQFLGPDRNGIINNIALASWGDVQPELLWQQDVGDAWSGFAVVNGFAITQEQRRELECVVCYEIETGNTVWTYSVERRHQDYAGFGRVGPRATPAVDNGDVYTVGATGVLDCVDGEDGTLKWSYDIAAECGIDQTLQTTSQGIEFTEETSSLAWGRSQSPLIVGELVIVAGGGVTDEENVAEQSEQEDAAVVADRRVTEAGATLIAIDKSSGKEVWRGGNRPVAYGSPVLATVAGVNQLLLVAEDHCVGHDVETGKELWSFAWDGQSNGAANCSQVTIVDEDHLLITKGYGAGAQVLKLEQDGGAISVVELKKDPRVLKTKFSNPVILDGYAYAVSDRFLECVEVMTLKKKWRRRGFESGQLLLVGDKLLAHSEDGELFLVEAVPDEYRELGSIKTVAGTCWNTLTLFKDLVLVRSEQEAACFRLPLE